MANLRLPNTNTGIHLIYYHADDDELTRFPISKNPLSRLKAVYKNIPCILDIPSNNEEFFPLDAHFNKHGISILGTFAPANINISPNPKYNIIQEAFKALPSPLWWICGNVTFLSDCGKILITHISQDKQQELYGTSDASLKHGKSTHA